MRTNQPKRKGGKKWFNRKRPPVYGELTIEQFEQMVDVDDFPKCTSCEQPVFNPEFYEDSRLDMCGPCTTGEADTIMWHFDNVDWARYA